MYTRLWSKRGKTGCCNTWERSLSVCTEDEVEDAREEPMANGLTTEELSSQLDAIREHVDVRVKRFGLGLDLAHMRLMFSCT